MATMHHRTTGRVMTEQAPDHYSDLDLPVPDACARCHAPRAAHTGWQNGGPSHEFLPPHPQPRPERIAPAHIQTDWTCTLCGSDCDVWGVADGWMECGECGGLSYLVPFANAEAQA